jgi:hypothetical protein
MKRRVYIYQENLNKELIQFFSSLGDNIKIESIENDVITLFDNDYFNEEPIDLESFQMLLIEDFDSMVTILIEPYLEEDFELGNSLKGFIKELPHNVYFFDDVITYIVLKNNEELKTEIKRYLSTKASNEVIHTVREFIENNMNSSVSAKKLYMHRNTLNYRIDNFIEATKINVKTFKGANAIYMLYKY